MVMEHDLGAMLRTAFSIYGVFWGVAIVGLFVWVGLLTKKEEQLIEKQKHGHH